MFRGDVWCFKHTAPSNRNGWSWLIVSKGDVRGEIDKTYSIYTMKRLELATIRGEVHTVIRMRNGDIAKLKRAGGYSALRNCINAIMSEKDGRRYYASVYDAADSVNAMRDRIKGLRFSNEIKQAFASRNTIRRAATDCI